MIDICGRGKSCYPVKVSSVFNGKEGKEYVRNSCCCADCSLDSGYGLIHHHGRTDTCPPCNSSSGDSDSGDSRPEGLIEPLERTRTNDDSEVQVLNHNRRFFPKEEV